LFVLIKALPFDALLRQAMRDDEPTEEQAKAGEQDAARKRLADRAAYWKAKQEGGVDD
jgi:hypothetical protein